MTKYIYDVMGRVAAALAPGDTSWACTFYDPRGRVRETTVPGFNGPGARTIDYTYSVGVYDSSFNQVGDPLTSSVKDASGTITTVFDLDGSRSSYTDSWGTVTTTAYNQALQITSATAVLPDGSTHSQAYTYTADGQVGSVTEDGNTIASTAWPAASSPVLPTHREPATRAMERQVRSPTDLAVPSPA